MFLIIFRSLTAIKIGVMADLEACRNEVFYRQSQLQNKMQKMTGDSKRNSTVLCYVDDDTFALLYGVFGVKATTVR